MGQKLNINKLHNAADADIYASTDRTRIAEHNRSLDQASEIDHEQAYLCLDSSLRTRQAKYSRSVVPAIVFNSIQHDAARIRGGKTSEVEVYPISTLVTLYPGTCSPKTMRPAVAFLVKIGLLEQTPNTCGYQMTTREIGPVYKELADNPDGTDTTFQNFGKRAVSSIPGILLSRAALRSWVQRRFYREHVTGGLLVTLAIVTMYYLANLVGATGTVSTVDIVAAALLTWLGLVGLIALVIGAGRRLFSAKF